MRHYSNRLIQPTVYAALAALTTLGCAGLGPFKDQDKAEAETELVTDLDMEKLTSGGCLNLPDLKSQLRELSPKLLARRYTPEFSISRLNEADSPLPSGFIAVTAFSSFEFEEKSIDLMTDDVPDFQQSGCESVEIPHELEGSQVFFVQPGESPSTLHLIRDDGAEIIIEVPSPREIRLTSIYSAMDPCPEHTLAKIKKTEIMQWGGGASVQSLPLHISRSYLRSMLIGLPDMPRSLADLAATEGADFIPVASSDLLNLRASSVSVEVLKCPNTEQSQPDEEAPPAVEDIQ